MAAKNLTTDTMIQLSGPWVDKSNSARQAIDSVPEMAPIAAKVEDAHAAILAHQPRAEDPRLTTLSTEANVTDARHDNIIRGAYGLLDSIALLLGASPEAEQLIKLRDHLLPEGLVATQKSYRAEAGQAERLRARTTPEIWEQLGKIPVLAQPFATYVEEWLGLAQRLGQIENERAALTNQPADATSAGLVDARNQWIRAVNALLANAELAAIDPKKDQAIFGDYRAAEKAADRRARALAASSAAAAASEAAPSGPARSLVTD